MCFRCLAAAITTVVVLHMSCSSSLSKTLKYAQSYTTVNLLVQNLANCFEVHSPVNM